MIAAWLAAIFAVPLGFLAIAAARIAPERLRAIAVGCAAATMALCATPLASPSLAALRVDWPGIAHPLLGPSLLRVSGFSAPLLLLPASLWLVTVAVTPRSRLDRAGLQRTALAVLAATAAFLTESPALLVLLWSASNLLFVRALDPSAHGGARTVARRYLWTSAALLGAGVLCSTMAPPVLHRAGLWLIVGAVLIRKGIFPFHAWIPEVFEAGRLGPIVRFSAPQLGAYVAVVLVVPRADPAMLRAVAVLSLVTAVYGAALAVVQRDARRACGYLFISQSALVLAGLDCASPQALAGSLVVWLSSALAFTGLARAVLVLEARRGRLDLSRHHGGYDQMPQLALSFLVLGLACTGFPGTLGFIGQEMLIEGAVHGFPTLGFLVVAAAGLTGIAVLRMYFSLFCGSPSTGPSLPLLRREALVFGAAVVALILGGLLPRPIVASRLAASRSILSARADAAPPSAGSGPDR